MARYDEPLTRQQQKQLAMPKLNFLSPGFADQSCELTNGAVSMGRSHANQIVLLDNSVSAYHCQFHVNGPDVIVRDLGSRNGTYVDGVRIKPQIGVRHGQCLRFGTVEAQLQVEAILQSDDTDITAFHADCRAAKADASSSPAPPPYPVILAARQPGSPDHRTQTSPPGPALEQISTPDTVQITKPKRSWFWAIVISIAILLALLWFAWH
jgi:pSer/pThr/pTyr-binding forkhead associated (FHA) protein